MADDELDPSADERREEATGKTWSGEEGQDLRATLGPDFTQRLKLSSLPARLTAAGALLALAAALGWVALAALAGGDPQGPPSKQVARLPRPSAPSHEARRAPERRPARSRPARRRAHRERAGAGIGKRGRRASARSEACSSPAQAPPPTPPPSEPQAAVAPAPQPAEPPPEPKKEPRIRDGATESDEFGF